MAGLFDTLGTARSGLNAAQNGIAVTGHNIANVNTPGYSRQRAVLQSGLATQTGVGAIGNGVEQVTVERIVEEFTQARLTREASRAGSLEVTVESYRQLEGVLNDQIGSGLADDLNAFFDALDDLANSPDPGQPVARQQLLGSARSLVSTVHRYDTQLRELQRSADFSITATLPEINRLAEGIAGLNAQIRDAEVVAPANDLRDQRDELLRQLAEKVEISTLEDANGQVSVRIAGGYPLVELGRSAQLVATVDPANPNPFDPTFSRISLQNGSTLFDVTQTISGGELGGRLEARNTIYSGAIRELDSFAYSLAESFNSIHQAGLGLLDGTSHDFFGDLTGRGTVDDAARLLSISSDIDPSQGGDLRHIAAGSSAVGGGILHAASGDTTQVELMKNLRRGAVPNYLPGDTPGAATGSPVSLSDKLVGWITDVGINTRAETQSQAQQESIMTSLQNRRDSISGVNMDEEVATLVQLQSIFQANSRVLSTVNQLFDELLSTL